MDLPLDDVRAVIASAKARETGGFLALVRSRHPDVSDAGLQDLADRTLALIEEVPLLMERAVAGARGRDLESVVEPVVAHAARYFTAPIDAIPEMTQGLAGLIDDAYFVLRVLSLLEAGPGTVLGIDLSGRIAFLRDLLGPRLAEQLDRTTGQALEAVTESVSQVWNALARQA
ncbi:MAG: hypothetical protein R3E98_10140 [Gemmatimonadota bacterium]|nr:DUF1232 domain-containing protein [Gemmatimonadota bacterium]